MKTNFKLSIFIVICFYIMIIFVGYFYEYNAFNVLNFSHWDSGLYKSISENGYYIEEIEGSNALNGNCGWFPLYPCITYIMKVLFGIKFEDAGFIVSAIFSLVATVMLLCLVDQSKYNISKCEVGYYFLFSLGGIYLAACFPMSLCISCINICYLYLLKKKYLKSGLFCFLACTTYSTAFLICGVLGCYLIYEGLADNLSFKKISINIIKCPFLGFCGFIIVQMIIYCYTGNYKAFFLTQLKYGHGIHNPLITLYHFLKLLSSDNVTQSIQGYFSLVFLMIFIFCTILFCRYRLYSNNLCVLSYMSVSLIYVFLLIMGNGVSPWRQYLLCSHSSLLLASHKIGAKYKLLLGGILFGCFFFEVKLFFEGVLV